MKIKMISFLCLFALVASVGFADWVIFDFDSKAPTALNFDSWTSSWFRTLKGGAYDRPTVYDAFGIAAGGRSGNAVVLSAPYTAAGFARDNIITCDLPALDMSTASSFYAWVKSDLATSNFTTTPYLAGAAGNYGWGAGGTWWDAPNSKSAITDVWSKIENTLAGMNGYYTYIPAALTAVDAVILELNMPAIGALIDWGVGYEDPGAMGPEVVYFDDVVAVGQYYVPVTLLDWSLE